MSYFSSDFRHLGPGRRTKQPSIVTGKLIKEIECQKISATEERPSTLGAYWFPA